MDIINLNQSFTTLVAATTNGTSSDIQNLNCRGLKVVIDITAISSATLTVTIQGKDVLSGKYYTLLAGASLSSTGTTVLTVYPGMSASANVVSNDVLPPTFRISYAISGTSVTATLGGCLIP